MTFNANLISQVKVKIDNALSNKRVFPSYIFAGSDRSTKLDTAKYISASLNCTHEHVTCGECANCKAIMAGTFHSFKVLSRDNEAKRKQSISVESVKDVRMDILSGAYQGYLMVYVSRAEDLTINAVNSLLKVLEDSPDHVMFVFDVANYYSVLPTVRSRSQVVNFSNINGLDEGQELVEGLSVDSFYDFVVSNSVQDLIIFADKQKLDRGELKEFLINFEAHCVNMFKENSLKQYLNISLVVRKYHKYLNRPVNVTNNFLLMLLEMRENNE